MDEHVDTSFEAGERDAETKVVTAVSWLERGQFLKREENQTQIFPASLKLTKEEADKRLVTAKLSARRLEEFRAILSYLYEANAGRANQHRRIDGSDQPHVRRSHCDTASDGGLGGF